MSNDLSERSNGNSSETKNTGSGSEILYIDDNLINLSVVERWLSKTTNYKLATATNAIDGLALMQEKRPSLVLLDINLPGMGGYELLDLIRKDKDLSDTPVVAVSANAMLDDIDRGLAAGFDDYITKPIKLETLVASINKLLPSLAQ